MAFSEFENRPQPDPFRNLLSGLSQLEATPISPEDLGTIQPFVKEALIKAGIHIEQIKNNETLRTAAEESQCRHLTTGKGPLIVVALDGPELLGKLQDVADSDNKANQLAQILKNTKTAVFRTWAQAESARQPMLESNEGWSKRRGLEQLFANLVGFAAEYVTPEDFAHELNWRYASTIERLIRKRLEDVKEEVGDGYKTNPDWICLKEELAEIRKRFEVPIPPKEGEKKSGERKKFDKLSSLPLFSPEKMWDFVLKLGQTTPETLPLLMAQYPLSIEVLLGNDAKPKKEKE